MKLIGKYSAWLQMLVLVNGLKVQGKDLFDKIKEYLGDVPIIAEDLGVITPGSRSLEK